jgi:hypothetical protein
MLAAYRWWWQRFIVNAGETVDAARGAGAEERLGGALGFGTARLVRLVLATQLILSPERLLLLPLILPLLLLLLIIWPPQQ